ncbi:MAG TPA: ORF6N domain-containing protein [Candidatus Binatia bacterium]|nr:ORF6N domain-containing protein [Candidatus Binatia bacterium]
MSTKNRPVSPERIEKLIFSIRGQKVMFDSDLAELYGVPVKRLNEQVRRNAKRFPSDFMLQLTRAEYKALR